MDFLSLCQFEEQNYMLVHSFLYKVSSVSYILCKTTVKKVKVGENIFLFLLIFVQVSLCNTTKGSIFCTTYLLVLPTEGV